MQCSSTSEVPRLKIVWCLVSLWLATAAPASHPPQIERDPGGAVKSETEVDAFGLPHGLARKFDSEGQVTAEHTFEHGVLDGPSRRFYPDGTLQTEWHYQNGKRHGLSIGYYPDGTVKDKGLYQDDLLEGTVYLYYPNGKMKAELPFKKDQQDGLSQTFYEQGGVHHRFVYEQGRLRTLQTYEPNGALLKEQDFDSRRPGR